MADKRIILVLFVTLLLMLAGCDTPAVPTVTPSLSPSSVTAQLTSTPLPSSTPPPTGTPVPTRTPTPLASPSATAILLPTYTPGPSTATATATATDTSTPLPSNTPAPPPTYTPRPTRTALPPVPTATLLPSAAPPVGPLTPRPTPPVLELDLPAEFKVTVDENVIFTPPNYPDGPLLAVLWLPQGKHYDAGIVMVHGGGLTSGDRKQDRRWGDELAARGFVVLAIDYPLMPGHPFPQAVRAVKTGVEYLRRNAGTLGIDPNKIALQGYSSGASLVAEAFVNPNEDPYFGTDPQISDRAQMLFAYYGAYNLGAGFTPDGPYYVDDAGSARGNVLELAANAPGPVYLWHATADPTIDWTASQDFADALTSAGKENYFYPIPNDRHVFDRNGPSVPPGSLNGYGQVCLKQELYALVNKLGARR